MRRVIALLLAVAATGCGGGPSEEEFRAEANEVCKDGMLQVDRVMTAELAAASGLDNTQTYLRTVRALKPVVDDTMTRLQQVEAPESAAPHVEKLVKRVREGIELAEIAGTSRGGLGDIQNDRQLQVIGVEAREAETAAGLKNCVPGVVS